MLFYKESFELITDTNKGKCLVTTIDINKGEKWITINLQSTPGELGICGSISSSLFPYEISIVATDSADNLNFNLACIGKAPTSEMVFMFLETPIYEKLKARNSMALFVVLHEIGHLASGDLDKAPEEKAECYEARNSLLERGMISRYEIEADSFAAHFLGRKQATNGLRELREMIPTQRKDTRMVLAELDRRIEIFEKSK